MRRCRNVRAPLIAALAVSACTPAEERTAKLLEVPGEGGVLFLAQNAIPNAFMDALFEGRVVADHAGCLRLDGPDPATVVWPYRFTLDRDGRVLDSLGVEIGRIGGAFRLGGGEVILHDGIAMAEADKQLAESRCPGRFWIVGDVP